MKICALASGSKGNATLVHNGDRAVLVDDGITFAMLKERLTARDVPLSDIKAVLITHEHSDHIKGVATLARHLRVPVYAPEQCIESIIAKCGGKSMDISAIDEIGESIAGFDVQPFRVPHDARYTVGYTIANGGESVGIATDLGTVNESIFRHLAGCDVVMLEANHDREMLMNGSYPFVLKKRIDSVNGHLSNDVSARTIARLYDEGVTKFVLAHLSEDNNTPEMAFDRVCEEFRQNRLITGIDYSVDVASFSRCTKVIDCK